MSFLNQGCFVTSNSPDFVFRLRQVAPGDRQILRGRSNPDGFVERPVMIIEIQDAAAQLCVIPHAIAIKVHQGGDAACGGHACPGTAEQIAGGVIIVQPGSAAVEQDGGWVGVIECGAVILRRFILGYKRITPLVR